MGKSSKSQPAIAPTIIELENGQRVMLECQARYVILDKNDVPVATFGEQTYVQDISDTVEAFKDTHDRQGFLKAADTLEAHCITGIQQTFGKALPVGCSVLCNSLSTPTEEQAKKKSQSKI